MVKVFVQAHDGKPEMLHVFEDEGEQADYYHYVETDCPCAPVLGVSDSGEYVITHQSPVKAVQWDG